jgi:hypothetical protein
MFVELYTAPKIEWFEKLPVSKEYPRHWITTTDLEIELSDGYLLKANRGTVWDGASVPKWAWIVLKPIDEAAIGDFIHDCLWSEKKIQLERFNFNIYEARLFADNERNNWRSRLAHKKIIKNKITHFFIRKIGGFFYSKQLEIPE